MNKIRIEEINNKKKRKTEMKKEKGKEEKRKRKGKEENKRRKGKMKKDYGYFIILFT
jgi:hypothetical protein